MVDLQALAKNLEKISTNMDASQKRIFSHGQWSSTGINYSATRNLIYEIIHRKNFITVMHGV